jgi:hypothetical protein
MATATRTPRGNRPAVNFPQCAHLKRTLIFRRFIFARFRGMALRGFITRLFPNSD